MSRSPELVHKAYTHELIKALGNKPLYDDQIASIAKVIPHFKGCYSSDNIPKKSGWYIVNTGNLKSPGIHWISMIRTPQYDYVYDSFGRPTRQILKKYNGGGRVLTESDRDVEQDDAEPKQKNICGHLSLAWLLTAHSLGIKKALLV